MDLTVEIVALLVGGASLFGVFAKVVHGIYRWAQRLESAIKYVEAEMRHNGGTTVRDAIARIDRRIDEALER